MIDMLAPVSLEACTLCPRRCGVDRRRGGTGYCRSNDGLAIASVTVHHGEEPVLSGDQGICNVFFGHCNLRCLYCQNVQISRNETVVKHADWTIAQALEQIVPLLESGIQRLGFVSPSHMALQMVHIIRALHQRGYHPVVVYNSNGYDRVETLRALEEWVDVYLPDCKYSDPHLASLWSGAPDYPQIAAAALKEMYRQKGNLLHLDDNGLALRGMIVRHLVLPGAVANSLGVLRLLDASLSNKITLSLMSQYQPIAEVAGMDPLGRNLLPEEYAQVTDELARLGFENGWVQEFASAQYYNPDFSQDSPFAS